MVDSDRLRAAYVTARCDLMAHCAQAGHWIGQPASSALSTAVAVSALATVERHAPTTPAGRLADELREGHLSQLIARSLGYLADHQNTDGGWGDTDKSLSNIATTMLVRAAFGLTFVRADEVDLLERADAYIASHGGVAGLRRRFGNDKTLAAAILTNCALAGLVPWRQVPVLPPDGLWQRISSSWRPPVASFAKAALAAISHVRTFHREPWNPMLRVLRGASVEECLRVLDENQPISGGFIEAVPLTSLVVMSLASVGRSEHPVVQRGLEFLLATARPDGSWPIIPNLATRNTTLAVNALAAAGEDVQGLGCLDWILSCQHQQVNAVAGTGSGGWAATDWGGGLPDVDDTASALLAVAAWKETSEPAPDETSGNGAGANGSLQNGSARNGAPVVGLPRERIASAAASGAQWLLNLQNADGGWPTCNTDWASLGADRSGTDETASALRALHRWRSQVKSLPGGPQALRVRIGPAIDRGLDFLFQRQLRDGSWVPLFFGNQHRPDEKNPVVGTSRVLLALRDLNRLDSDAARRGLEWLVGVQNRDGGWGGEPLEASQTPLQSSVEETALALEAVLSCDGMAAHEAAADRGLKWLVDAVEANEHQRCSPIGLFLGKLWYYESLYPLIFSVAALGQAVRRFIPQPAPQAAVNLDSIATAVRGAQPHG